MKLADLMHKEFSSAKLFWRAIILIELLLTSTVAFGIVTKAGGARGLALGALGLIGPLLVFALRLAATTTQSKGEHMRRLLLLQKGLGREPSAADRLRIASDATALPALDLQPVGEYFTSDAPAGLRRLAHLAEEAAFYTRALAKTSANICGLLALLGGSGALILLWIAFQIAPSTTVVDQTARLVSLGVVYFFAGTLANMWWSFRELGGVADATFLRCDDLRQRRRAIDAMDLYLLLGPYDAAVMQAPPLPSLSYRLRRRTLDAAWSEHAARTQPRG